MTKLQQWLLQAGGLLGVEVLAPIDVSLDSGSRIEPRALVVGLGGGRGVLVFASNVDLGGHGDELRKMGYGYSVVSEPGNNEVFDLDSFREMFIDWGLLRTN